MTHETDRGEISPDNDKHSKRERFRDALTRTKSKFKKEKASQEDFQLSDDVNDFLAAGRTSTSSRSNLTYPKASDPFLPQPPPEEPDARPPSRGAVVPKIDVSQSQRWPEARPLEPDPQSATHLYAGRRPRSQSFGGLAKKRQRPRGLSVSFDNGPPVIIGEGGDEATTPSNEICSAKQRARSLSPAPGRGSNQPQHPTQGQSPVRRKPVSPVASLSTQEHDEFVPRPLRRIQTGMKESEHSPFSPAATLERHMQRAMVLDHDNSAYSAEPPQTQQSPASYMAQQAQRLNTTKPAINSPNLVIQRQQYGASPPRTAPQPMVHRGDVQHQAVPPYSMDDEPRRLPQPMMDDRTSHRHQPMSDDRPEGWI